MHSNLIENDTITLPFSHVSNRLYRQLSETDDESLYKCSMVRVAVKKDGTIAFARSIPVFKGRIYNDLEGFYRL